MRGVPQLDGHQCKTPAPCPDLEPGPLCPLTKPETPHAKTSVEDTRGGGGHLEHLYSRGRHVANWRFPKPIARDLPCSSVRSEETTTKVSHRMKRSCFVVTDDFIERGFCRRKLAEAWTGRAIRSCTGSRWGHSSWTGSSRGHSSWTGSSRAYSSWTGSSRVCSSWTGSSKRGHSSRTGSRVTHSLKSSSTVCSSWTGSSHRSHSPPWSPHRSHSPPWSPHMSHSLPWSPHRSHSWSRNRLAHSSTRACSSRRGHSSRSRSPHSRSHSPHSRSRSPHSRSHSPHSRSHSPHSCSPHSWSRSPHSRSRSPRNSHSSPWFWWVEGGAAPSIRSCRDIPLVVACATPGTCHLLRAMTAELEL
ncbi:uncharacterized protein C2orf16-like [Lutra lutra]|uniref:uncharacterized protein C2orf16-like n=1 Tax=Lutra lutra TaxID=9657 RepID=UPI001FD0BC68|nr:uncharacterized protein C2orf16-like [Lutra lutra]